MHPTAFVMQAEGALKWGLRSGHLMLQPLHVKLPREPPMLPLWMVLGCLQTYSGLAPPPILENSVMHTQSPALVRKVVNWAFRPIHPKPDLTSFH